MRIVHEVQGEVQVGAGGHPWATKVGLGEYDYRGFRVELFAVIGCDSGEEEAIHIEGDAATVRKMLADWIDAIDGMDTLMREQHEASVAEYHARTPPPVGGAGEERR